MELIPTKIGTLLDEWMILIRKVDDSINKAIDCLYSFPYLHFRLVDTNECVNSSRVHCESVCVKLLTCGVLCSDLNTLSHDFEIHTIRLRGVLNRDNVIN